MCGRGSCLGSSQLHSIIYIHTISDLHSLPRQDSLYLRNALTTTLTDAPGLSWDCHYQAPACRGLAISKRRSVTGDWITIVFLIREESKKMIVRR